MKNNARRDYMLGDYWEFMSKLVNEYGTYRKIVMDTFQMPAIEVDVMLFLANNTQYDTAYDIVRTRHIPKSHVSLAVKGLMQRGYLTGIADDSGRKKIHLKIMPSAREMVEFGQNQQRLFIRSMFSDFTPEEESAYKSFCCRIMDNISKTNNERILKDG